MRVTEGLGEPGPCAYCAPPDLSGEPELPLTGAAPKPQEANGPAEPAAGVEPTKELTPRVDGTGLPRRTFVLKEARAALT